MSSTLMNQSRLILIGSKSGKFANLRSRQLCGKSPKTEVPNERKSILITGANRGIGFATASILATQGHHLTLLCRNDERGKEATNKLVKLTGNKDIEYVTVDHEKIATVISGVEELERRGRSFDTAILNAAVMLPASRLTPDGNETTFQVNYMTHFLLSHLLIHSAGLRMPSKVVTVTSVNSRLVGWRYWLPRDERSWPAFFNNPQQCPWKAYALTKFALALLAHMLNKVEGMEATTVNPGIVPTGLSDRVAPLGVRERLELLELLYISADEAAKFLVEATKPNFAEGCFQDEGKVKRLPRPVVAEANEKRLEYLNRQIVAKYLPS